MRSAALLTVMLITCLASACSVAPADCWTARKHGHDADSKPVSVRHVGRDEVDARLLEPKQEMRVAG